MKDKLKKIYDDTIPHSSFLDEKSILSCMYQSYMLGAQETQMIINESKRVPVNSLDELYDKYESDLRLIRKMQSGLSDVSGSEWDLLPKEEFINKLKTDSEFANAWGIKIEIRDMTLEERLEIADNINKNIRGDLYSFSFNNPSYVGDSGRSDDEQRHLSLNEFNIPTKIITTFYKGKRIESYE